MGRPPPLIRAMPERKRFFSLMSSLMTNWPTSAGIGDTQREGKEQKFPRTRFGFATSIVDFVKHCIYVVQSKIDDWLNTFYSYKSEMKYSNDQFERIGVGDCTFTRYFKTTLTLVAVATSVLALRGENHDFSWPLMTQGVDNIGNCNRSVQPQISLLLSLIQLWWWQRCRQ